ncbi:MAG: endonuclease III [Chloroflexi bacterium]|nr:MAG: endonuclease III [Chloroflexota bacterium]
MKAVRQSLTAAEVSRLLAQKYGALKWDLPQDPLSELILTLLSQNTSGQNTRRAFSSLRERFGSWEAVAEASVEDIAQAIKGGGLAQVKAARIKAILETIRRERGGLDLSFLAELPLPEAKAWLRKLPGVGPKTVACVLLFSLGRPVLPVDTHVYRVSRRLGLISARVSPERAQEELERQLPPEEFERFHLSLIEHGRRVCRARRPHCELCILRQECPEGSAKEEVYNEERTKSVER